MPFPRSLSALIVPCAVMLVALTTLLGTAAKVCLAQIPPKPTPTETKLYIVPGGPVYAGKVVNFKAWVSESGAPVKQGVVYFCDAAAPHCSDSHILAQVQLRSSGTAEVNLIPPRGTHEVQAVFQGTKIAAASKSAIESLVVTGPHFDSVTTIIGAYGTGPYSFNATVISNGQPLSGYVNFYDRADDDSLLGEALLGPVSQTFVNQGYVRDLNSSPVAVADFNGDGRPDLIVDDDNGMSIVLGKGDGTFGNPLPTPVASSGALIAVVGDFNGDDILDLVTVVYENGSSSSSVLLGNGDGTFLPGLPVAFKSNGCLLNVGDVNNDGIADLIYSCAEPEASVSTFLGIGDGTFVPGPVTALAAFYRTQVAEGDFNGDGKLDLAVGGSEVLLGNGDGSFAPDVSLTSACYDCYTVVAADFNQDGKTDLAISDSSYAGSIHILLGKGNGTFTQNDFAAADITTLGTADFNGDGIADLIANALGVEGVVYLGDGTGSFPSQTTLPASEGAYYALLADLNSDGRSDIIETGYDGGVTGNGDFADPLLSEVQASAYATGVADPFGQLVYAEYEGNKTHKKSDSAPVGLETSSASQTRRAVSLFPNR